MVKANTKCPYCGYKTPINKVDFIVLTYRHDKTFRVQYKCPTCFRSHELN